MTNADTKRDIQQAAADWLVRVQEPDVTEADLLEWDAWLKADRRHQRAFDALESASAFIAREQTALSDIPLPNDAALRADTYIGEVPIAELIDHSPNSEASAGGGPQSSAQSSVRNHRFRWAIAATLLLTIGTTVWLAINEDSLTEPETQLRVVETKESEHRSIELEDGSTIALGAASSLSVNYSGKRRTVVLEAGEALFEVAKDPNRPFVVLAGNGTITAVGTAFNVRRDADRVVVTVTEGEVEVVQQGG
ncbi:MAG: FecR domain-containing protein, partial [Minwuiales bacterium]|nr:FecR domain-containing protein [Minwuiales bacterium]